MQRRYRDLDQIEQLQRALRAYDKRKYRRARVVSNASVFLFVACVYAIFALSLLIGFLTR